MDLGTIAGWGSKLVGAERALLGAAPATDEAARLIAGVADEVAGTAADLGTNFYVRGQVSVLDGVAELLRGTAGNVDDANAAVWNLRQAGDELRGLGQLLRVGDAGGAASFGGGAAVL